MLKEEFPGVKFLLGPGLHRVAPGVEEVREGTPTYCRLPPAASFMYFDVVGSINSPTIVTAGRCSRAHFSPFACPVIRHKHTSTKQGPRPETLALCCEISRVFTT